MNQALRQLFEVEMEYARGCMNAGRLDVAMRHLQRAHIIGQRHVVSHVRAHWAMLRIGWMRRSPFEVIGQMVRIVLGALGSAVGIVPTGNPGSTDIGMFRRVPVPADLQAMMDGVREPVRRN